MNEQRFTLDVSKEPAVLPVLYLGQGDKNGTTLVAELYDNGVALSASGYVPSFEMRLPGGKAYYKVDGTLSGNVATIPIDETYAAAVAGRACTAYVSLKSGGNVVSTTRMNVAVLESATNDVNPGQAYENGVEEFLEDAQEQLDQATASADSRIASAASSAASQVAQAQEQATAAIAQAQADQQQAADDLNAALDALGDISEVAVPLMSETTRGGAKLGSGLVVDDGKLSLGDVVTDSHDGPIYSAHGEGWAEQASTTGKNLAKTYVFSGNDGNVSFVYDGMGCMVSGTGGSSSKWTKPYRAEATGDMLFTLPAGMYTFSKFGSQESLLRVQFVRKSDGAEFVDTFSLNEATEGFVRLAFGVPTEAEKAISEYVTFQLEAGSTATEYEPYTGTKPSPSPDYPQEIRVARGRNLLPNDTTSQTVNGVTFTLNADGSVTANGTAVSSGAVLNYLPISGQNITLQAGTYTLSGCPSGGSSSTYKLDINDKNDTYRTDYGSGATFALSNALMFRGCRIVIYGGVTVNNLVFRPQLELGSTPTPYVPYGHVGLEVRPQVVLYKSNYYINAQGVEVANAGTVIRKARPAGSSMTATCVTNANGSIRYHGYDADGNWVKLLREIAATSAGTWVTSFDVPEEVSEIRMSAYVSFSFELVSVTPIPLPSKGFAASLPDGTADALSVDSAGRYEWENACEMHEITAVATKATGSRDYARVTLSPTETRWASAGEFSAEYPTAPYLLCESWPHTANQYIAPTWNQTIAYSATSLALTQEDYNGLIGAKLLGVIPKANRITEHGYINLPEVPEGSTITIPELEDVGIRCFVNGAWELAEHANNWGRRCKENESRIAALEAAIANLATS